VLIVTSGAVGLGKARLGLGRRRLLLPERQACAAVGQGRLMALYAEAFEHFGIACAQVLLTDGDFTNRYRYLNLRSTINRLLELRVIPIVNENDTVSTSELEDDDGEFRRISFGDNDRLSALVASKIEADLLVILTDVDGLHTADPRSSHGAQLISVVEELTPEIEALAGDAGAGGRGGMRTKLDAARIAMASGCAVIVASGTKADGLRRVLAGEELGTLFLPRTGLTSKRRWIAFATTVEAAMVVNEGAYRALVERGASLLAAGVTEVKGTFERGDVVSLLDEHGREFARGIVNYASREVRQVSGQHSARLDEVVEHRNYDALVTRDNIALLETR
jgi:glutamate 5-kinase